MYLRILAFAILFNAVFSSVIYPKTQHNLPVKLPFAPEIRTSAFYEINVSYTSAAPSGTFTLLGTVTAPSTPDPNSKWPAVLLVPGSGPVDRNIRANQVCLNWVVPQKPMCAVNYVPVQPFFDLAEGFAAQGIVTLRYDKRVCTYQVNPACSYSVFSLNFTALTINDFITDAVNGVEFLASLPYVDASRITIIGHSEGAGVVPSVALQSKIPIRNVGLLMGTAISYSNILLQQTFTNSFVLDGGVQACYLEGNPLFASQLITAMTNSFNNYVSGVTNYALLANNSLDPKAFVVPLECVAFGNCLTNAYFYSWNNLEGPDAQRKNLGTVIQQGKKVLIMNSPQDTLITPDIYRALHVIGREIPGVQVVDFPNVFHLLVPNDGSSPNVVPALINTLATFILQ